ncbi:OTU-like cysteine protease, putative [Plasmodium knowlesi strain H]|uniref:OTU-like cysteine protease, putative n=2 Tax=Plasmodium knowlesi TaxID=5850 RepID=B3L276_PLAKH|nr:OTU-like cysteine protease, putative [Plasmodium knowlesi strain H]OTN68225.1 putative OTU-like cysteine protease [Plasmodium knowlesi]CAA9987211.1 OTU-like cysteine protease, putative [Plasmodium knowlesi strain H]VVS76685.1 OTU-like cysteine protease, putative [Plasmodium knowlesi strain H]|eukprot:XP_002261832.1 OTU-like cysteine protease, putative [Plasmodium knowlesi strain H]
MIDEYRGNSQKRKKAKEKKKKNDEEIKGVKEVDDGINYSLINDYHDSNFKKNFYIKSIRTDGNCLFRAVSDQLYNNEDNYKEIRRLVVDHLLRNEQKYQHFIEYDESYKSYIDRISLDGTWGGQLELQAVGELFNVNILIYQENECILEIKNHSDDEKCIQLHYASSEHYNSVRFKNRALENELKSIVELREILNNKDDSESTKTFYETTDNELTEDNEEDMCDNTGNENNNVGEWIDEKEFTFNNSVEEEYLQYDCPQENNRNNIFSLSDDETEPCSLDILQNIYNGIKRKGMRSRSMPTINENFLYFFSKNHVNESMDSDSTIDVLNERKGLDMRKPKKIENRKLNFLKYNYIGQRPDDLLSEYVPRAGTMRTAVTPIRGENKTIRICYNKTFHKYLCLSKMMEVGNNQREEKVGEGLDLFNGNYMYSNGGGKACRRVAQGEAIQGKSFDKSEVNKSGSPTEGESRIPLKHLHSAGRQGYISNFELENNLSRTKKKTFENFLKLYSEKISYSRNSFCKSISTNDVKSSNEGGSADAIGSTSEQANSECLNYENARNLSLNKISSSNEEITAASSYFDKEDSMSFEFGPHVYDKRVEINYLATEDDEEVNKCILYKNGEEGKKFCYNLMSKSQEIFDIIIDEEYVLSMNSSMLFSHSGNKHVGRGNCYKKRGVTEQEEIPPSMSNRGGAKISYPVASPCVLNSRASFSGSKAEGRRTTSQIDVKVGDDHDRARGGSNCRIRRRNHQGNCSSGEGSGDTSGYSHTDASSQSRIGATPRGSLKSRDLFLKKKYLNKKFINMFSKDIHSKGLFHFLNADFLLTGDKVKYIIPFLFNSERMNIFKDKLNRKDFHFSDYVTFSFNLDEQKLRKKIECSKVLNEEFLIKEKHKYSKFTRGGNGKSENRVKIISI